MFDITKNIKVKNVVMRYIESCETLQHVKTMRNYLKIYKEKLDDFLGHHQLNALLNDKEEQIKKLKYKG